MSFGDESPLPPPTTLEVLLDPLTSTSPLAVQAFLGSQPSTFDRRSKGFLLEIFSAREASGTNR
jgi:hypothetical protein